MAMKGFLLSVARRTVAVFALASAGGYAASPSFANEASAGPTTLEIPLEGRIEARCGLTLSGGELSLGEWSGAAGASAVRPFRLDCNTPFRIALTSRNGAVGMASVSEAFAASLPFDVALTFDVSEQLGAGTRQAFRSTACSSVQLQGEGDGACALSLAAGGLASGNGAIAIGAEGNLRIAISPTDQPVLAGQLRDSITLEVRPD